MKIRLGFLFTCKFCGKTSTNYKEIKEDEAKCKIKDYKKKNTPIIPEGMIFGEPQNPNAFYRNITFCIAKKHSQEGEYVDSGNWACRQNSHGDTLGDNHYCGGNGSFPGYDRNIPDIYHITFKRMYKYLKHKIGIENITVWNGQRPINIIHYLIANGTTLIEYDKLIESEDNLYDN